MMFMSAMVVAWSVAGLAPATTDASLSAQVPDGVMNGVSESATDGVDVPVADASGLRIAVYRLDDAGVDHRLAQLVNRSLLVELRKLERVSIVGMDEIQQMLDHEAQKQIMGCSEDESCVAEISGALGVDQIITGNLARVGDEHVLGLRRIDQRDARVVTQFQQRLVAEDGEEFLAAIGPAVAALFPDRALKSGAIRGVDEEVALRLNPPPLDPWVFYAASGVASILVVGAALSLGVFAMSSVGYATLLSRAETQGVAYSDVKAARDLGNLTALTFWTFTVSGVFAAVTTGVLVPFVDWKGYRDVTAPPNE